jgi:hypothetical protein
LICVCGGEPACTPESVRAQRRPPWVGAGRLRSQPETALDVRLCAPPTPSPVAVASHNGRLLSDLPRTKRGHRGPDRASRAGDPVSDALPVHHPRRCHGRPGGRRGGRLSPPVERRYPGENVQKPRPSAQDGTRRMAPQSPATRRWPSASTSHYRTQIRGVQESTHPSFHWPSAIFRRHRTSVDGGGCAMPVARQTKLVKGGREAGGR